MNYFDTDIFGRARWTDLGGVSICSCLWVRIVICISGILISITPIISQLIGGKANKDIPHKVQQGIYLAIGLAFTIVAIGVIVLNPILNAMDLENSVRHTAKYYLITLSTGIIPLFIFNTLRN